MSKVKLTVQKQERLQCVFNSGVSAQFMLVSFHTTAATENGFGNLVVYYQQTDPVATKPVMLLSNPTSSDTGCAWFKDDLQKSFERARKMLKKRIGCESLIEIEI